MTSNIENEFEGKTDVDEVQVKVEYLQAKLDDAINRVRINRSNNQTKGFQAEYQAIWDDLSQSWINYRKQDKS